VADNPKSEPGSQFYSVRGQFGAKWLWDMGKPGCDRRGGVWGVAATAAVLVALSRNNRFDFSKS
jgi:hypothetical protein